jgi:MFS family permease
MTYGRSYKRYVLLMLTLVTTLQYLDRGLMALLLQPIKEDLHLSDTQLGFLTGIAFGLFYAILGVPIARWADRGDRVGITSVAIGLWSVTMMLCLFVTSFIQLVSARIAAAIGESGCLPPTYSLVGDYFAAPAERTRAMAVYMLAGPLSALIAFAVGGWLSEELGWRATFLLMGIPALFVAVIVKVTIAEPRMRAGTSRMADRQVPRLLDVLSFLWRQRTSRHLIMGLVLLSTMGLGLYPWYSAFMIRSHGLGTAELGTWLGFIFGIGGVGGTLLGGYVAARFFGSNDRGQMRLSAITIGSLVPWYMFFLLAADKHMALFALLALTAVFSLYVGPTLALIQRLVPEEMRATTLAVVMLLANLIGMGMGPQVVGILSDLLMPVFGSGSLRYAMLAMSLVAAWAAYHFWRAGQTVREDLIHT